MLLLTVGYGAAAIAGQDEDGTLCLQVILPVRRTMIVLEKVAAMAIQAGVLAAAVAASAIVGRSFDLTTKPGNVVATSALVALMGIDFGLAALTVGARVGRRGTALGVVSAVAAASYLLSSLAMVVSWLRPARYFSLFYWSVGRDQLSHGVSVIDLAVLSSVGAVLLLSAVTTFDRFDVQ
jgi:ABC-2 type transport system permease protein